MTDGAIIGAFVFMVGLILMTLGAALVVHVWHDWAADRKREAEYAEQWAATHRHHQDLGRYGYQTGRYHVDTDGQAD